MLAKSLYHKEFHYNGLLSAVVLEFITLISKDTDQTIQAIFIAHINYIFDKERFTAGRLFHESIHLMNAEGLTHFYFKF